MEIIQFAGLEIVLAQLSLVHGQRWSSRSDPGLWCAVILDGEIDVEGASFGRRTWRGGASLRYYTDGPTDIDHAAPATNELLGVFLRVSPDQIEPMFGADAAAVQNRKGFGARIWEREPLITSLGWQMLGCSLTTNARRLYMSGKALELLSVMAETSTTAAPVVASGRPREIQQVHDARARLLADLQNPPSVPELAQAVGLNARRLGELFKVHFGTTVYAFLKTARFDRARLLLETGGLSVAQVAYQYGYQPAHFSTEFKRRFGIPPTTLRRHSGH